MGGVVINAAGPVNQPPGRPRTQLGLGAPLRAAGTLLVAVRVM